MTLDRARVADRIERVEALMHERGLDALLAFGHGSALGPSTRSHGTLRFLFDWDGHHCPSLIVLPRGGAPVLLVPNLFLSHLGRDHHWIEDVRFVAQAELAAVAAQVLDASGHAAGRCAIVGRDEMPVALWEALTALRPGTQWVDITPEIDRMRMIKDAGQIACHRRGAALCDAMFERLARELRVAQPAFVCQAGMEHEARAAGAEYVLTWLTIAPAADYSRYFREECRRVAQAGDQILAGVALMLEGHWAHAVRTGCRGTPSAAQRELHALAQAMQQAMLDRLVPGAALGAVQPAAEALLRARHPDADDRGILRFRHGHGLGCSYDDPVVSRAFRQVYQAADEAPDAALAVEPGMVLELHPNLFVPGVGGACIGDTVLIEADGPRCLTAYPRALANW